MFAKSGLGQQKTRQEVDHIQNVGDHLELMQKGGLYSQLYRRQLELAAAQDSTAIADTDFSS